jgi:hypothetical protein
MNRLSPNSENEDPVVSDGGKWVEAVESLSHATVLPPRRAASDVSDTTTEADRVGLRIEPHLDRVESPDGPQRIEVQEFTGSIIRLEQPAPSPQKIARQVKFLDLPVREEGASSASEEGAQWGLEKRTSNSWMVSAGAVLLVILILCLVLLPLINSSRFKKTKEAPLHKDNPITAKIQPKAANPLEGQKAKALELFSSYVTATTVEEALLCLRDRETIAPLFRARWQPTGISKQWQATNSCGWIAVVRESLSYAVLRGELPDQSEFYAYFINDGQKLLLDWKATIAYSSALFTDLEKKQGDLTEVRGKISPTDYYSLTWPEKDYQSFKFTSPDLETTLWAYSRRRESADIALLKILGKTGDGQETQKTGRVTLRLAAGPETALPNQWLIQELLHPDWINP